MELMYDAAEQHIHQNEICTPLKEPQYSICAALMPFVFHLCGILGRILKTTNTKASFISALLVLFC